MSDNNRREWQRQYQAQRRAERASLMDAAIGSSCLFCGDKRRGTGGLVAHRTDGAEHKAFHRMGDSEFAAAMHSGGYVRVCYKCHHGIHWAMEFLGLMWEEIKGAEAEMVTRDPCKIVVRGSSPRCSTTHDGGQIPTVFLHADVA